MENLPDDDDPYMYKEAMEDVDSRHWQKEMQSEIESMFDNKVWSLVDLPKWIKTHWLQVGIQEEKRYGWKGGNL